MTTEHTCHSTSPDAKADAPCEACKEASELNRWEVLPTGKYAAARERLASLEQQLAAVTAKRDNLITQVASLRSRVELHKEKQAGAEEALKNMITRAGSPDGKLVPEYALAVMTDKLNEYIDKTVAAERRARTAEALLDTSEAMRKDAALCLEMCAEQHQKAERENAELKAKLKQYKRIVAAANEHISALLASSCGTYRLVRESADKLARELVALAEEGILT